MLLSTVVLFLDLIFVWINYRSSQKALLNALNFDGESTMNAFIMSLDVQAGDLQQMAALVAGNKDFQDLLLKGKKVVEGKRGGAKAESVRKELFAAVEETWSVMRKRFGAQRLTFYLAPGSLSFLRMHDPEQFGDRMDTVRYSVVEANAKREATKGFETGESYTGIWGIVPVFADDPTDNENIHVGAVEVGTSFPVLLPVLDRQLNAGFAVLLSREHLKSNMRPDILKKRFSENPPMGNFFLEATSRPEITTLLENEVVYNLLASTGTRLIKFEGLNLSITSFPLRDFMGNQSPNLPDAGRILFWQRTKSIVDFEKGIQANIVYGIAGFIVLEIFLFFVISRYEKLTRTIMDANKQLEDEIVVRKQTEEKLKSYREQLRNLNHRLQSIREEEKTHIAREVHDELGQALTALKMELACLESELPQEQPALQEIIRSMGKLIDSTVTSVQRICTELRPQILDVLGLCDAIEWETGEYQKRTGIQCEVSLDSGQNSLDRDRSTTFFRIFQEMMTNVARHADASKVQISFKKEKDYLVLEVKDDGKGIESKQIHGSKSFGLMGIRERALLWGGEANIEGAPGKGTTASVKIPHTSSQKI